MNSRRKRKFKMHEDSGPIDLNVMPFIDVFSLLTTFLLFSAVFINIGVVEVQAPFFSNKETEKPEKTKRTISVNVSIDSEKIELETFYETGERDSNLKTFDLSDSGITAMHKALIDTRVKYPLTDKMTLFVEDDVGYDSVMKVVDAIKFLAKGEENVIPSDPNKDPQSKTNQVYLYPKVVMGNVIL
ncbi:MAG: biopolymer transporter ExbD [Proteobacteria bacterium]|nr:biopolymer transporter ExbD [Pseudomonadota bacterium]